MLSWEDRLNTGVRCFDEEHKTILSMLNVTRELLEKGDRKQVTDFLIKVLIPYLVSHLRHEEEVFALFNYEEGERHTKVHASVEGLFRGFIPILEGGGDKVLKHVEAVLMGWLYGHIEKVDKKYGTYFMERGLIDKVNEIEPIKGL